MCKKRIIYLSVSIAIILSILVTAVAALVKQNVDQTVEPYYLRETVPFERVVKTLGGEREILSYEKSEVSPLGIIDYYQNLNGDEYRFDPNGTLLSYSSNMKSNNNITNYKLDNTKNGSLEEMKKMAEEYARKFCQDKFCDFELVEFYYNESQESYSAEYHEIIFDKYIGEMCFVIMDKNGSLQSVGRPLQSQLANFDPTVLESVDDEVLNKLIDQDVHRQFVGGSFTYTVNKLAIREQNEQLGIMAFVTVYPSDGAGSVGLEVFYPLSK